MGGSTAGWVGGFSVAVFGRGILTVVREQQAAGQFVVLLLLLLRGRDETGVESCREQSFPE